MSVNTPTRQISEIAHQ